jgi:Sortilin, neurotensin receptor 3,
MYAPPYSQDSAVGLILAVGNIGQRLERKLSDMMSTYLSRDGGISWAEVRKGPYIYELGDHGGLIVMAKHNQPTTEILYSFNEGKSWHDL